MTVLAHLRHFDVALLAVALLMLPCGAALARDSQCDCEDGVLSLEAPRVRAMMEAAEDAERGSDRPVDPERAALLYCKAASYGSLEAQYRLGRMALKGWGMPRDVSVAATLFGIASDNGHQAARSMLLLTGEREPKLPDCLTRFQAGRKLYEAREESVRLKLVTRLGAGNR